MDELLETDFAVADKDHLYRCLDRILAYKQELFVGLRQKWAKLFAACEPASSYFTLILNAGPIRG